MANHQVGLLHRFTFRDTKNILRNDGMTFLGNSAVFKLWLFAEIACQVCLSHYAI